MVRVQSTLTNSTSTYLLTAHSPSINTNEKDMESQTMCNDQAGDEHGKTMKNRVCPTKTSRLSSLAVESNGRI